MFFALTPLGMTIFKCTFYFHLVTCPNELPYDYGTGDATCTLGWTCQDWAGKGKKNSVNYCQRSWSDIRYCVPKTNGRVDEFCQQSCDKCGGKYEIYSVLRYTKIIEDRKYYNYYKYNLI